MRRALMAGLMLVGGCGEDAIEPAQLGALCGSEAPVRVLELPEDTPSVKSLRAGGRVLHFVHREIPPQGDMKYSTYEDPAVWATGECGEAPVKVATGVQDIFVQPMWPDTVLGCMEETGDVVVLDPEGGAPKVLFEAVPHFSWGCGLKWTPHGLLSVEAIDEETGKLWLHPYPEDPRGEVPEAVVLLEAVRMREAYIGGPGLIGDVVRSFDDFVLAVTPDDELVRVDVADGAVSVLQTDVYGIEASVSGRYVLWRDLRITKEDAVFPEGAVFLRDQEDGSDVFLAETSLGFSLVPLGLADVGIVQLGLGYINVEPKLVFFVPDFNPVEVSAELFLNKRVDDRRVVMSSFGGEVTLADLRAGESRRLSQTASSIRRFEDDAVVLLLSKDGSEAPLWRVPFDGSASKLASRVGSTMRWLKDGRLLTALNVDGEDRGDLVVIDLETGAARKVDGEMYRPSLNASPVAEDGVVSYFVADGDRSGVYFARLPEYVGSRQRVGKPGVVVEEDADGVVRWGDGVSSSSRRRR